MVLGYLDNLGRVSEGDVLLALTRTSTSANLSQVGHSEASVQYRRCDLQSHLFLWQSNPSKESPFLNFVLLHSLIVRLCPLITRTSYKEVFRSGKTQLFLAAIKPHRAVSSSSIARWLKWLLEVAKVVTIQLKGTFSIMWISAF